MSNRDQHAVSVVIPCYNAAPYISDTIKSVLGQTRAVDEVIIVDDGSTDASAYIAGSFGYPVRVIRQANRGVSGARNRGVKEAEGDVIAFLDADDLWHPEKIEHQLAYLDDHPEVGAVTASTTVFEGDSYIKVFPIEDKVIRNMEPRDLLVTPCVSQSGVAVRAEMVRAVPYPEGVTDSEDVIQSVMLRTKTEIGAVEEPLIFYRLHPRQAIQSVGHRIRSAKFRVTWAKENYQLLGFKSPADAALFVLTPEVEKVMTSYWSRDLARFKSERSALLQLWPAEMPPPRELMRFVAPRSVLLLRDIIGKFIQRSKKAREQLSN